MHIDYDKESDLAYLYLKEGIKHSEIVETGHKSIPQLYFDYDENGILLGIEFFDASRVLPKELLNPETVGRVEQIRERLCVSVSSHDVKFYSQGRPADRYWFAECSCKEWAQYGDRDELTEAHAEHLAGVSVGSHLHEGEQR